MKAGLTSALVLAHGTSDKEFVVSTDASKFAVGATLEQNEKIVAFLSHRVTEAETRWCAGDQELLTFMIALPDWDVYLKGRKFTFRTDHEPIRYLQTKPKLPGRQSRWLDSLRSYTFQTRQIPEKKKRSPRCSRQKTGSRYHNSDDESSSREHERDCKRFIQSRTISSELLHYFKD